MPVDSYSCTDNRRPSGTGLNNTAKVSRGDRFPEGSKAAGKRDNQCRDDPLNRYLPYRFHSFHSTAGCLAPVLPGQSNDARIARIRFEVPASISTIDASSI